MNIEATETVKQGTIEIFNVGDIVFIKPGTFLEQLDPVPFSASRLNRAGCMVYPRLHHTCVVQEFLIDGEPKKILRGLHDKGNGEFILFPVYFLPNESTILTHLPDAIIQRILS